MRGFTAKARGRGAPVAPLDGLLAGLRLALGVGDGPADRRSLSGVADWPATARLAMHHQVGTLFLKALRSNGVPPGGAAAAADLARRRGRDVFRGMRQLDAMRRATAGLAERGIPALVLKGLPLGQRVYGSPFAKSSIDVDLLVAPDRFPAAGRVLCGLGWRRSVPDYRETPVFSVNYFCRAGSTSRPAKRRTASKAVSGSASRSS